MDTISALTAELAAHFHVVPGRLVPQGRSVQVNSVDLRLYAWRVSDNGVATGTVRPADERRIQVIGTAANPLTITATPETLVLGLCDDPDFSASPLIVAFNPWSVGSRVNSKLAAKANAGNAAARASDSQQFRQWLLDKAAAVGLAQGTNQHDEIVIAMRPERFLDYLKIKPQVHPAPAQQAAAPAASPPPPATMGQLVDEAALEIAPPADDAPGAQPAFDPAAIVDERERVAREIAARRGQPAFRAALIERYTGKCAFTGTGALPALEAAHIVPYQGVGSNHPENGLLLRADIHTLFDLWLLAVDPATMTILVSPLLANTDYATLAGAQLQVPAGHEPSREALAIHRKATGL